MSNEPKSVDDLLFEAMRPSALIRAERAMTADDESARTLAEGRAALEALARSLSHAPPSPNDPLRARLLASLAAGTRSHGRTSSEGAAAKYGIFADRLSRLFDISIPDVHALLARLDDPSLAENGPATGITWLEVDAGPKCKGALAAIGRLVPGTHFPHHTHVGEEVTFLLDGGFRDQDGEEVWRGDEVVMAAGTEHDFVVLAGVDCIAAVVAYGGVEIEGYNVLRRDT